jgi:hypothetical protein
MSKLFSINDVTPAVEFRKEKSSVLSEKFEKQCDFKIENLKQLLGKFPEKDEILFLWSIKSFNAFTFIPYILSLFDSISELVITTYSIDIPTIDEISKYLETGRILNISFFISDSANFRIPKVMDHLNQFMVNFENRASVRFSWNHSKVTLIKTGNHHFVFEGSGNFSTNSRHEQYIFLDSEKVYNFRKNWIINELYGRTT